MIVNPAEGVLVRDPATHAPIENGAKIDPTEPYFARALADGDLVPVKPQRPSRAKDDTATGNDEVKA